MRACQGGFGQGLWLGHGLGKGLKFMPWGRHGLVAQPKDMEEGEGFRKVLGPGAGSVRKVQPWVYSCYFCSG